MFALPQHVLECKCIFCTTHIKKQYKQINIYELKKGKKKKIRKRSARSGSPSYKQETKRESERFACFESCCIVDGMTSDERAIG